MAKIYFTIAIVLALVTAWFVVNPVFYPDPCEQCTNATEKWIPGSIIPIIDELVTPTESLVGTTNMVNTNGAVFEIGNCSFGFGPCTEKEKYFPVDTLLSSILFTVFGIRKIPRKKEKRYMIQ